MKDGGTRLAHNAEHAADLETGAVVGVTVQDADAGDTTTTVETLTAAAARVDAQFPNDALAGASHCSPSRVLQDPARIVECTNQA